MTVTEQMAALTQSVEELKQTFIGRMSEWDDAVDAKKAEVDDYIDNNTDNIVNLMPNLRLTSNQALIPNADGSAPLFLSAGNFDAELVDTVVSGVDPADRSSISNEFLSAINCNRRYLSGGFNIWRYVMKNNPSSSSYGMYQLFYYSSSVTIGAIMKHESGDEPYFIDTGTRISGDAKLYSHEVAPSVGMAYRSTTLISQIEAGKEATILIALPAVITGRPSGGVVWSHYPYINPLDTDGKRLYDQ